MQYKKKLLLIASTAAFLLLLAFNIINFIQLNRVKTQQQVSGEILLDESAVNRKTSDYLNNIGSMLAYDLNRTRVSLGLPVRDYPFKNITDDGPIDEVISENNVLIDAVDVLMEAESDNRKSAMLGRFLRNDIIVNYIEDTGSSISKQNNLNFSIEDTAGTYAEISASSESSVLIKSFSGEELNVTTASKEAVFFLQKHHDLFKTVIDEHNKMKSELYRLSLDKDITSMLGRVKNLNFENNTITVSNIYNSEKITAELVANSTRSYFTLNGTGTYEDIESLKSELIKKIKEMDLRTLDETIVDNAKTELELKLADSDFKAYLKGLSLHIADHVREDNDYIYYDLIYADGTKLGSFSILKKIGEIYLVDADEVPVSSLKTMNIKQEIEERRERSLVIPENIPEIDSLYSNSESVTFLLVGNHELNTDTMILVHADKTTGKAYMIGIPRDLYWKGRKINSIYLNYGAEQFKKELSEITGLEISNYIIVDMYAFIDIVNILGGIEVTLEEDLVDPTYKIRENGEWSTLNYSKGTYNLNGVESLRVARSRHGSNDFERSKRQQQIIEVFLNKILELKITDIDKVYNMMQAIFEYIDTDFTLVEMMSLFNNYSDVELAGKHVLSFDNILYDTYSNIYLLEDKEIEFDENFNKGAWILFPVDNDWNNIRWYVRRIINGEI
ncbi:MAG: LCP family protein [Spirochaetales bacterium]|uniref:LCP family protein n=1 Tax=Candidatus Thalassospirochaeta sargassi TaxID=3119039 RepID=A0AAJ1IDA1_9SPIO|nr:LCP family protein [Spirochaetales bacterium]